jgi:hypothetical protein
VARGLLDSSISCHQTWNLRHNLEQTDVLVGEVSTSGNHDIFSVTADGECILGILQGVPDQSWIGEIVVDGGALRYGITLKGLKLGADN